MYVCMYVYVDNKVIAFTSFVKEIFESALHAFKVTIYALRLLHFSQRY